MSMIDDFMRQLNESGVQDPSTMKRSPSPRKILFNRLNTLEDHIDLYTFWHIRGKKGLRGKLKKLVEEKAELLKQIEPLLIKGKTYFELEQDRQADEILASYKLPETDSDPFAEIIQRRGGKL